MAINAIDLWPILGRPARHANAIEMDGALMIMKCDRYTQHYDDV